MPDHSQFASAGPATAIASEHQRNAEAINQEILTRWLQGKGKQPVTWSTLIEVLKDMNHLVLAKMIEKDCDLVTLMQAQIQTLRKENAKLKQQKQQVVQTIHDSEKEKLARKLAQAQQKLRQQEQSKRMHMEKLRQSSEALLTDISNYLDTELLRTKVSGPGLQSATVNHPTHVIVELTDSSNRPCSVRQKITAKLELISKATPTSPPMEPPAVPVKVAATSPSRYEVSYTAISRGQHKLHVKLNDVEINDSPFTMTVYPDPTQLAYPVRVVTDLDHPYGIAFNSREEMIVSESESHQIAIFDIRGQRVCTFGSHGDSPEQMILPGGIAIDDMDNIYVSSDYKLQKFTSSGEMIKCVGQRGRKEGEFDDPRGVTLYNNQVYVCDSDNHRIQVFDLDLNFIRSIGSYGKGRGEFAYPFDIKFDTDGCRYVADYGNTRVQVLDRSDRFIQVFGQKGKGKLHAPTALNIVDKYVYVSDRSGHCIVVYETSGQFVTSFGGWGHKKGEFHGPYCITSCGDGFIHVCDRENNKIQIF